MHYICTNFYSNYLLKGVAFQKSLFRHSKNTRLWILCMDDESHKALTKLKLKHTRLVRLKDLENKELKEIKKDRNKGEYSWTLKSVLMNYIFNKHKTPHIFYLDADIYFFENINLVYNDIGNKSVAIAPHRFPKNMSSRTKETGIFNAGVIYLKNNSTGRKVLDRWTRQCLDWCYWRLEDGKLGDQMYLDEWPKLYGKHVHQFKHKGINLAPWNVNEYDIKLKHKDIYIDSNKLIFYHFHQFKIFSDLSFDRSFGYHLDDKPINYIYKPYEAEITSIFNEVKSTLPGFDLDLESKAKKNTFKSNLIGILTPFYWRLKATFNK